MTFGTLVLAVLVGLLVYNVARSGAADAILDGPVGGVRIAWAAFVLAMLAGAAIVVPRWYAGR